VVTLALLGAACSDDGSDGASTDRPSSEADGGGSGESGGARHADDVTALSFNVLHGLFCDPDDTDWCQAPERIELTYRLIEEAGCPDLVGFQEIGPRQEELIVPSLPELCDGEYTLAWDSTPGPDREMVLSRLPIVDQAPVDLANFPWAAYWVRVESDVGPVDFLTTHMASSSNNPVCTPEICPPVCEAGITTNECNAIEVVEFLDERREPEGITIASGDLNAPPGSSTLTTFTDAGYVDTWLEAGNAECDPGTGDGCTGGTGTVDDTAIVNEAAIEYTGRIDYVLVMARNDCDVRLDGPRDRDDDKTSTGVFAEDPVDDGPGGIVLASDHRGVQADLSCA